jgi:hypothetical protein
VRKSISVSLRIRSIRKPQLGLAAHRRVEGHVHLDAVLPRREGHGVHASARGPVRVALDLDAVLVHGEVFDARRRRAHAFAVHANGAAPRCALDQERPARAVEQLLIRRLHEGAHLRRVELLAGRLRVREHAAAAEHLLLGLPLVPALEIRANHEQAGVHDAAGALLFAGDLVETAIRDVQGHAQVFPRGAVFAER